MQRLWRTLGLLLIAMPASAGTIIVPPLISGQQTSPVCVALLVGHQNRNRTRPRTIQVTLLGASGEIVSASKCTGVLGGQVCTANGPANSGPVSCRVKVRGDRKALRVSLIMLDDSGMPKSAIAWHQEG